MRCSDWQLHQVVPLEKANATRRSSWKVCAISAVVCEDIEAVKFRHLYRFTEMTYEGRWRNVEFADGIRRRLTGDEAKNFASLSADSKVYRLVSQRAPSFSEQNVFDWVQTVWLCAWHVHAASGN